MARKQLTPQWHESHADDKIEPDQLDQALEKAVHALKAAQHPDGHWCFELEADCTIPSEYIIMMHFVDEIDNALQQKMTHYLLENQNKDGGWPLYYGGDSEISCSVKAYYALKLAGHPVDAPYMQKAKTLILKLGGAAKANVFTRITLALFEQIPWRGVPFMPIELILAPRWFPFHIHKVSYWSRTVMIPLLVLCSLKAKAKNPKKVNIQELFVTPPQEEKDYFPARSKLNHFFIVLSKFGQHCEWLIPGFIRKIAIRKAMRWTKRRLNNEDGLGAIFPAMVNAFEALHVLNHPDDKSSLEQARNALKKLVIEHKNMAYCQPCLSPVWDTTLAILALQAYTQETTSHIQYACDWLKNHQILKHKGDWKYKRPNLEPGGWAFQYNNPDYPDLDDTGLIVFALHQANDKGYYSEAIRRGAQWLIGMQSDNGGFGSFDINNNHEYLNEIPFADHGALLDPPTADVSARVAMMMGALKQKEHEYPLMLCINFIFREQEKNGSWFGRWGTNYIYGTWSVLAALEQIGFAPNHPAIRQASYFLKSIQNDDGGWGEDNGSYFTPPKGFTPHPSTSFQTAWALLALMAAQEHESQAVKKGIQYLLNTQGQDGFWHEPYFTAPGFPKVFYLKYHGYSKYFPLWALAKYKHLIKGS